jgi:heat shock protein HtpX
MKRVFLFLSTNVLIMGMLTAVAYFFDLDSTLDKYGLSLKLVAPICFAWGLVGAVISLLLSKAIAKLTCRVELLDHRTTGSWLVKEIESMSKSLGIKTPEIGVYESIEINAFATGPSRNNALIAFSTAMLNGLSKQQILAVAAHELAHVANGDMITLTLLQGTINSVILVLARLLSALISWSRGGKVITGLTTVFEIAFSISGLIVTAWFSRQREFRADRDGANLVGVNLMIETLDCLRDPGVDENSFSLSTSKIAGFGVCDKIFSSHPSIDERIRRLRIAS